MKNLSQDQFVELLNEYIKITSSTQEEVAQLIGLEKSGGGYIGRLLNGEKAKTSEAVKMLLQVRVSEYKERLMTEAALTPEAKKLILALTEFMQARGVPIDEVVKKKMPKAKFNSDISKEGRADNSDKERTA